MQIAISMLSQTGGHGDGWHVCGSELPLMGPHPGRPHTIVDGADEMRRTVRRLLRAGADVLKVATSGGVLSARDDPRHPHFRPAELDVLVEEAEAAGVAVMAHAQGAEGIKAAVRAGIRSIEHGIFLDDEAIDLMLERGTWLVPTLAAPRAVLTAAAAGASLPQAVIEKARAVQAVHDESVTRAIAAGVKVAMGTDSGVGPHGDNLVELGLMAGCGMTPEQAWHATTLSAAELLGVAGELGSLEPGKRADVVVLDGDPTDLTKLSDRIREVYRDGELVAAGGAVVEAGVVPPR
jgi:imidazolonepropionase-like amidohydrolase